MLIPVTLPAGSDTQVQFNRAGLFGGSSGFTVNYSTNTVTASTFIGNLTGNVTGNTSGSAGSVAAANLTGATLAANVLASSLNTFGSLPTFVAPLLGTPTSGNLANCVGLPISSGVSGLGTGVATALGGNVGTSGALVTNGGALGTPSSGNLANCTFPTLNQNTTGSAATLTTARTLWSQSFNGAANVTGDMTSVGNVTHTGASGITITGGASNMTIVGGTGASRTLALNTTNSGSTQQTNVLLNDDGSTTFLGSLLPTTANTTSVGSASQSFTNHFIASGGTLNFANGDVIVTHSSANLPCSQNFTANSMICTNNFLQGSALGAAGAAQTIIKNLANVVNNSPTNLVTVTIPNATLGAGIRVALTGTLGDGDSTNSSQYMVSVSRISGSNTVLQVGSQIGAVNTVGVTANANVTLASSSVAGANNAQQTYILRTTIARSAGTSNNHWATAKIEELNSVGSGITIS